MFWSRKAWGKKMNSFLKDVLLLAIGTVSVFWSVCSSAVLTVLVRGHKIVGISTNLL